MELLAKTCKILYDKQFLDTQKECKEKMIYSKVLYDNKAEYVTLCREFKAKLPHIIAELNMSYWEYYPRADIIIEHSSPHSQETIDWENKLEEPLQKLTKYKAPIWVKHIKNIINSIILGIAKSIAIRPDFGGPPQTIEISSAECNRLIVNIISSILFFSTNNQEHYEMIKIQEFICNKCKKTTDWLYCPKEYCLTCFSSSPEHNQNIIL